MVGIPPLSAPPRTPRPSTLRATAAPQGSGALSLHLRQDTSSHQGDAYGQVGRGYSRRPRAEAHLVDLYI